jgi:hypothetical protein
VIWLAYKFVVPPSGGLYLCIYLQLKAVEYITLNRLNAELQTGFAPFTAKS